MKRVVYAKLNKTDDTGKQFLPLSDATLKDIDTQVASTLMARYYKGVSGSGEGLVIEVNDEE